MSDQELLLALTKKIAEKNQRIAELEAIRDAAANLVRAEGWQIERDNLWDTLHDLIDAEGDNDE